MNHRELLQHISMLPPARARMALEAIAARERHPGTNEALEAFQRGMRPVCDAIVDALKADDRESLEGLRGMLPGLLKEVNQSPELADVYTKLAGKALMEGMEVRE